ncbi:MAG: CDP-diacylglycerol--glycerol-3-phosphate 3-phosphatidyltransferase [Methylophilaceae bacterium]|nr:CDP-diacylglycerol--glycerol-3-phosphate 3-phosphatidyltransferase [Methylophilaceae bacterium]
MKLSLPTMLTWLRILLIPVFVAVFYVHLPDMEHSRNVLATTIFGVAALTDWLDGYLARKLNQTSAFGAFLDPVADKLMVVAALVVLVELRRVGVFVALIIIGREIAISALREWMAGAGGGENVGVALIGKIKTTLQMVAILFLLYWDTPSLPLFSFVDMRSLGRALILIAAWMTLISMAYYLYVAWAQAKNNKVCR